jgi:hypothetical protein
MKNRLRRSLLFIIPLLLVSLFCKSQQPDSTEHAVEIYKKKKETSYVIKTGQRVLVKCKRTKGPQTSMVVAELLKIEGGKMYFQPLNTKYKETIYTKSTLDEIGIRTKFRVAESIVWFVIDLKSRNIWDFLVNGSRGTFKVISLKSNRWGIRIIDVQE